MLKIKRNKKLMIPVLAMVLVVAMAGSALAATTSYSMVVPAGEAMIEYDTHLYGATGYDTYKAKCTSSGVWFQSRAYCETTYTYASEYMDVGLGGIYYSTEFDDDYASKRYKIRFKIDNCYTNQVNNVSGRYGLE